MHRALRFATGAVILATAFLLSCHDQQNNPTAVQTNPGSASAKAKKGFPIPKGWIEDTTRKGLKKGEPDLPACDTYDQFFWVPDHYYRPVPGYSLGVWNVWGLIDAKVLHDRYCFTGYLVNANDLDNFSYLVSLGYHPDSLLLFFDRTWDAADWSIYSDYHVYYHPNSKWYFCDEPFDWSYDPATRPKILALLDKIGSSRTFSASSWNMGVYKSYDSVAQLCPNFYIMCDIYNQETIDSDWDAYFNHYATHNRSNWLNTSSDNDVMGDMFRKAAGRGWNTLWCYFPSGSPAGFCDAAAAVGWLEQRYHYYQIHWVCTLPNPCTNCEWGNPQGWVLDYDHHFYETTEWF